MNSVKANATSHSHDQNIFPRSGTYFYRLMNHTENDLPRSFKWYKRLNKLFMIPLYRLRVLPLFGIGWVILMIQQLGGKRGKFAEPH
jgi:hypothetical protein